MPTLSSLTVPQIVDMPTCGATSDDKVGIQRWQLQLSVFRVNNREAGDLKRHRTHYGVTVMY